MIFLSEQEREKTRELALKTLSFIETLEMEKGKKITVEQTQKIIKLTDVIIRSPNIKSPLAKHIEYFRTE